ncbi:hypothetical protein GGI19_000579 [Coemansia pectinata]|uniref:Uncharacterized protein n=1 Tax=Coemansia pectinata TaxID=1052879 RepID=A0A9W8H561_9FUNG|nr:hypothetical protein GGI19_000579 [Coemansia pectinata]
MDRSHTTATIGRSQRGMDSMRGLREMLAQVDNNKEKEEEEEEGDSSDVEDIDSETAMNTVYNLLSELGDLNRSNRRTAEALAEKFNVLQAQVNDTRIESSATNNTHAIAPSPFSEEEEEEATFHTPPSMSRALGSTAEQRISSATQTDLDSAQIDHSGEQLRRVEAENKALRQDVKVLMAALREHQDMGREYEATLARALVALRSAAFERHLEISDVQARYRELLTAEQTLNGRLQNENIELRAALSSTAQAIRTTLSQQESS